MKKLLALTLVIAAVTLLSFWGSRKVCMLMWPGSLQPSQAWYENLGLNATQMTSLKEMEARFRQETDSMCMRICQERMALLNLMRQPKAEPQTIYGKIEEIGALQVSLEKAIATHILSAKSVLTPAQSQAYLNRIQQELQQAIERNGYGAALGR